MQFWMLASPVAYPSSLVPTMAMAVGLNPDGRSDRRLPVGADRPGAASRAMLWCRQRWLRCYWSAGFSSSSGWKERLQTGYKKSLAGMSLRRNEELGAMTTVIQAEGLGKRYRRGVSDAGGVTARAGAAGEVAAGGFLLRRRRCSGR